MLACQLHAEGEEPNHSEAAVAMLLTSPRVLDSFSGRLKAQARLFRPIEATPDAVPESLETLLAAEQMPPARIRHLWFAGLSREGRHATLGAIREAGLVVPDHDVDQAIGKPGYVMALLLQALAAKMVAHGQGVQMIASSSRSGVVLNLVGTKPSRVPGIDPESLRVINRSSMLCVSCLLALMAILMAEINAGPAGFWCLLVVFVLMFPLQFGSFSFKRRQVEEDFYGKLRRRTREAAQTWT